MIGNSGFIAELRRRHVFRVAVAYLAGAWLLIQVLETLLPIFGLPETSIRVVVVILAIGFVPAVILSWVFEWTPAGLQRDAEVADDVDNRQRNTRNLDRVIIVTLTIAVAYFAIDEFVFDRRSDAGWLDAAERAKAFAETLSTEMPTVAVLPFRNVSAAPEHEHFAVGLSEEVLNSLTAVTGLRVISRTSSFAVADKDISIGEIAAILGVDHILEGSVRRAGDKIRVTANLVDARADLQLWSEAFDRQLTVENVFDIQSEIAARVTGALDVTLVVPPEQGARPHGPADFRALDLYHDGLHILNRMSPVNRDFDRQFDDARQKFEAAIAIDPEWAPPHAMLGTLHHKAKRGGDDSDEWLETSERHLSRALELDPDFGPAHGSMAYLRTVKGDYAGALQQYDRAIALGASKAHWGKALALRVLGRHDEAITEFLAAAAVDPLDEVARFQLFETYYCAGRFRDSIDGLTRFVGIDPGFMYGRILTALVHAELGDAATALAAAEAIADELGQETPLATVFAVAGENERALQALDGADESGPFIVVDIAPAAVLLGDRDRAITMLEGAANVVLSEMQQADRYVWLWRIQCSPVIRQLEDDPRYEDLLARLGLAE